MDRLNKLLFSRPKEAPYEIWLQSAQWFQSKKMFENVDIHAHTHTHTLTTETYLYYKLINEPKGSGELKSYKSNTFRDILLTWFKCPNLQRATKKLTESPGSATITTAGNPRHQEEEKNDKN